MLEKRETSASRTGGAMLARKLARIPLGPSAPVSLGSLRRSGCDLKES